MQFSSVVRNARLTRTRRTDSELADNLLVNSTVTRTVNSGTTVEGRPSTDSTEKPIVKLNVSLRSQSLTLTDIDNQIRTTKRQCARKNKITERNQNKNLCGRDGRTICGPLRVPKSTYLTLAHKRKPKFFFYFGCSLVRRCNCKQSTSANGTDGQTDRQTDRRRDRQTDRVRRNMRPPPREEGRIMIE